MLYFLIRQSALIGAIFWIFVAIYQYDLQTLIFFVGVLVGCFWERFAWTALREEAQ